MMIIFSNLDSDKTVKVTPKSLKPQSKIVSSPIWQHVLKGKKGIHTCVYCKKEFKDCGNTTNMTKHLQTLCFLEEK